MTHHLKTRIVLANGAHAKWLEREGEHFATIDEIVADASVNAHRPGAAAVEHGRSRFGGELARRLNRESAAGDFERLAIVAPPEVMRAIRDGLLPGVRNKVVHELAKDLTKTPPHELGAWLDSPLVG